VLGGRAALAFPEEGIPAERDHRQHQRSLCSTDTILRSMERSLIRSAKGFFLLCV
jgi:hypothetical protein